VTLTDAGPLVALVDADEADHRRCIDALAELSLPLLTTWPALTEAMYLLGENGWRGQEPLWRMVLRDDLVLATLSREASERSARLMERYSDRPMDLADATLVAVAEELGLKRIFSLDSDFHIYRRHGRQHFEVLPG
jgi:uncharacterized protein